MLDIKFLRENTDIARENIKRKGQDNKLALVDKALQVDTQHRALLAEAQELRAERNKVSKGISEAKKAGKDPKDLFKRAKDIPQRIKEIEVDVDKLSTELHDILYQLPNLMHESVPVGKDESENKEDKRFGDPVVPNFEVKNHAELIESMGLANFEASRRVAGNGFFYLLGDLALLDFALQQFAIRFMIKRGYTLVTPPYMINHRSLMGVTDLSQRDEMIYKIKDEELYLIGTSEHSLIAMFIDQQVDHTKLPIKLCGISPCFRREIGSHGIDEKGLFRTHQFNKIEQIVICNPDDSWKLYDEMLHNGIDLFVELGIPVRSLLICSGDLGDMKMKQHDVEAWSPRRKEYFEVQSCSNLGDNQARLLNIRVRHHDGNYYPHTLNDTAIATSRAMVAILENNQQEDGSVKIPDALVELMGKDVIRPVGPLL